MITGKMTNLNWNRLAISQDPIQLGQNSFELLMQLLGQKRLLGQKISAPIKGGLEIWQDGSNLSLCNFACYHLSDSV